MAKNSKEKQIFKKAFTAKSFLYVHGFLSYSENEKLFKKLSDYQDKHKIKITDKEADKL